MTKLTELIADEQEIVEIYGITIMKYKDGGRIVAVKAGSPNCSGQIVRIGQMVSANGHYGAPKGTLGIVIGFHNPLGEGCTSDIVVVWFEGFDNSRDMKFKDLDGLPIGTLM